MFTKASIITLFAGLAAAQIHPPVGEPKGNPILKPLNEIVPLCEPFKITWQPTTTNTVSVLLLKGPSTNVVKFGPSLAEGISNSGSLDWTPASTLETTDGPNGYGLQIIDDVTGQYQYSTQFGFSKGNCKPETASSSAAVEAPASSSPAAAAGYPAETPAVPEASASSEASVYHVPQSTKAAYPTVAPYPTTVAVHPSAVVPVGTASGVAYSSGVAQPTGAHPPASEFTGAASSVKGGLAFAGAFAGLALMF